MEAERLNSRGEFERVRKETFVEAMLLQVADGLASDARYGENSANRIRRRVEDIAYDLETEEDTTSAGRAVLESRFALGHDDSQYLAQAVSLLWAGDGGERLRVVPPALMPEIMRQASADGIVRAMKSVMVKKQAESMGRTKDGLELAGWLMQMEEVRDAVLDYMGQSQFDTVKTAAGSIRAQYDVNAATGMEYVMRLIDHSPDEADNVLISGVLLEAVYVLTQEGSHPMRVVDRLVSATKSLVDRAAVDSAIVFELAYALGTLTDDMRIDDVPETDVWMDICPQYDANGARAPDSINTKPSAKQFQSSIDAAFNRIVGESSPTFSRNLSNVEVREEDASNAKPWVLGRVVSPLWNQGSLLEDESAMADVRAPLLEDESATADVRTPGSFPNEGARIRSLINARDSALARPYVSVPESRFDRIGNGMSRDSMFVTYCMIRGLCGHKGPHQRLVGYDGPDPLAYSYPTTKMKTRYRRGRYALMENVQLSSKDTAEILAAQTNIYSQDPDDLELDTDFFAHVECQLRSAKDVDDDDRFEDPNYASYEDARPVMWAPVPRDVGATEEISYDTTCKRVCEASVYEFMVTSLKTRAGFTTDASHKRLLRAAAACAKLRQVSCLAHIKSVDMSRSEFMSLPSQRKANQFVTRPCQHCASPEIAFAVERTLLPVDCGIAMFVNKVEGSDADLYIRAPNEIDEAGYKTVRILASDGAYTAVEQATVTHWLRAGVERGVDGYADARDMSRTFGMHIEADPENEPVEASKIKGKVALEGRGAGLQWLVPQDVNLDTISNLMAASMQAASNMTRIKHEEAYIFNLDKEGSQERQAIFGLQKSIEDATRDRRAAVWSDALREVAISGDRLYRFVTTLTGAIGEAADSAVSWEDEDLKTLSKEATSRQKALVERVSRFQTKLVESVVSSTLKGSKLQLDVRDQPGKDGALVVLSSDVKDSIRQITDGEAGHGFFEASVELNNIMGRASKPMSISDIVRNLQNVSSEYHDQIAAGMAPSAPASYQRVVEPRNSFMLHLKPDTSAAIQKAFDYITSEMRHCDGYHRHIHLWEFVEGSDWVLTTRFAELVGLMLQNTRMRSGNFAAYVGTSQLISNGHNIRMQIQRLKTQVCYYLSSNMDAPMFLNPDGRMYYFGGSKKPSKRKDGKFTEQQREKRRKNRDAPFGGDDGDDRDDRPGLPSNFPRESVKREVLDRMIQNARMRSNLARQAATDGSNTGRLGITLKDLTDTIKANKFIPAFGATTEQALEVTREYLFSTKPRDAASLSLLGKAVMQYAATAHVTDFCKKNFADTDGKIPRENETVVSICDDLMSRGFKSIGGYLERPKERVLLKLRRVGRVYCYKIKLETKRHLHGLINKMHTDSYRVERIAYALNTLFGMDLTAGFKAHNPDYDWRPHPRWGSATNTDDPNYNVWVKYVSVEDAPYREMLTQVYNECRFLVFNNKVTSLVAATTVLFSAIEAAHIFDAKDLGAGYVGALFSTLMSWSQAMSGKAKEYVKWMFPFMFKGEDVVRNMPPKGMDPDARSEIHPMDVEIVARAMHERRMELEDITRRIENIELEAASSGLPADDEQYKKLKNQAKWHEERIKKFAKALSDKRLPPELEQEVDATRKANPNSRTLKNSKTIADNPEVVASVVDDYKSGELVKEAASMAFVSAGVAKTLPSVDYDDWVKRIDPNFRIYADGMALGLNASEVMNLDNAAMVKHFQLLAKKAVNPFYNDEWTGVLSDIWMFSEGGEEAQKRVEQSRKFASYADYFQTRELASTFVDTKKSKTWSLYDQSSWWSTKQMAAKLLSKTSLALLKLDITSQKKIMSASMKPYYKVINDMDFNEGISLAEHFKKPAVKERLINDLIRAYGVSSKEELEKDGVIDMFTSVVEKGGIEMRDGLADIFMGPIIKEFFDGVEGLDKIEAEKRAEEYVRRMSEGKDIGGQRVLSTTSAAFSSMPMIERPRTDMEQVYYSLGKFLVEGVESGRIIPPAPSKLTYASVSKLFKVSVADSKDLAAVSTIFNGVTEGMASDAVRTYLYHETASKMSTEEQKYMSMSGVTLQKIGFGAAIDKAIAAGSDLTDKEDLCSSLAQLEGIGQAAFLICRALTTAKKPGTGELAFTKENKRIIESRGKLSFVLVDTESDAEFGEVGIDLKEVYDLLESDPNRGTNMANALTYLFDAPNNYQWEMSENGKVWKIATHDKQAWKFQRNANKQSIDNAFKYSRSSGNSYQSAMVQLFLQNFGSVSLDGFPAQERLGFQNDFTVVPNVPLPDMVGRGLVLSTIPEGNFETRPVHFVDEFHPQYVPGTSIANFIVEGPPASNTGVDENMWTIISSLNKTPSPGGGASTTTGTRTDGVPPATPGGVPPATPPPGPPPSATPSPAPPSTPTPSPAPPPSATPSPAPPPSATPSPAPPSTPSPAPPSAPVPAAPPPPPRSTAPPPPDTPTSTPTPAPTEPPQPASSNPTAPAPNAAPAASPSPPQPSKPVPAPNAAPPAAPSPPQPSKPVPAPNAAPSTAPSRPRKTETDAEKRQREEKELTERFPRRQ